MADLAITATSVIKSTGAEFGYGDFGETVTAGMPVYLKSSDSKLYKAQADGTAEEAAVAGIALNGGAVNQRCIYQKAGDITIGGTLTVGIDYYLSATAGGIAPRADLASGNRVVRLGFGKTASVMTLDITNYGVTVP